MTTRRFLVPFVLSLSATAAALFACSEATDGEDLRPTFPSAGSDVDGAADGDSTDAGKADGDAPKPSYDATTTSQTVVLLNEISGGDEWIELVNAGTTALDVSGFRVADRDKDTGGPKVSEAAAFEPGTILSPRAYALVKGGGADAGKPCPAGGWSYCVFGEFGISSKNGETIFLLWPDGGVAGSVVMPPADSGAPKDATWSRVPSGTPDGGFALRSASPGARNPD